MKRLSVMKITRAVVVAIVAATIAAAFLVRGFGADPEKVDIHSPVPTPDYQQPQVVKTVVPGADRGGLFGDGVMSRAEDVAKIDTSSWKTYESKAIGVRFRYPPDWELTEGDNSHHKGPLGEPSYPIYWVRVHNPKVQWGSNLNGLNCNGEECLDAPPTILNFAISVESLRCPLAGELIRADSASLDSRQGQRCVLRSHYNERSVSLTMSFARNGDYVDVMLEKGREANIEGQLVLEAILASVRWIRR